MNRRVSDSSDEGIVVQQLPRGGLTRRVSWTVTIVVGRLR
jgi:beta-lactam-binding protein with PASTA domain